MTDGIGLFLMTEKGLAVLEELLAELGSEQISHITTAPARGMNDESHEAISQRGKKLGIPTFLHAPPPEYHGRLSVAVGWRWLLDVPNLVVIHDSLLPRYRGHSPLITSLVRGEKVLGATAFIANERPDAGPIIDQVDFEIRYPIRSREAIELMTAAYRRLAASIADAIAGDPAKIRTYPQDESRATYSLWRDEYDFHIDWSRDAASIRRLIDAASDPFSGAWTTISTDPLRPVRIRIDRAEEAADLAIEDRVPGKVWLREGEALVVCGRGMLRLLDPPTDLDPRSRLC